MLKISFLVKKHEMIGLDKAIGQGIMGKMVKNGVLM
jgi:hypothetical protein